MCVSKVCYVIELGSLSESERNIVFNMLHQISLSFLLVVGQTYLLFLIMRAKPNENAKDTNITYFLVTTT